MFCKGAPNQAYSGVITAGQTSPAGAGMALAGMLRGRAAGTGSRQGAGTSLMVGSART